MGAYLQLLVSSAHVEQIPSEDRILIAIKKAKHCDSELTKYFDKEVKALEEIKDTYHSPHLIKPIAAYKYGEDRCLMFLWAEGGNLDSYWQSLQPKDVQKERVYWFVEQLVGICSALEELHTKGPRKCVHGDLKPENILVFGRSTSEYILQIADLGLAAFHEQATNMRQEASRMGSGTSRYKPPEYAANESRSKSYDIWSMGCILLEFLVWSSSGYEGLKKFRSATPVFWDVLRNPILHTVVAEYIRLAEQELKSETVFSDMLQLIKKRLLVVKRVEALASDGKEADEDVPDGYRIKSKKLRKELEAIKDKCKNWPPSYLEPSLFELPSFQSQQRPHPTGAPIVDGMLAVAGQQPKAPLPAGHSIPYNDDSEIGNNDISINITDGNSQVSPAFTQAQQILANT